MKNRNAEQLREHREWYKNKYHKNPEFRAKEIARRAKHAKTPKYRQKLRVRKFIEEYCSHPGDKELKEILE